MAPRESIYAALFERLSTIPGIKTASRRWRSWDDVSAADSPALFQVQAGESVVQGPNMPAKHEIRVSLYLYARVDQANDSVPTSVLNPLVDAIEAELQPDPIHARQTLGGLVNHCRIEGDIQTDEGVLGSVAAVIIPILILVP